MHSSSSMHMPYSPVDAEHNPLFHWYTVNNWRTIFDWKRNEQNKWYNVLMGWVRLRFSRFFKMIRLGFLIYIVRLIVDSIAQHSANHSTTTKSQMLCKEFESFDICSNSAPTFSIKCTCHDCICLNFNRVKVARFESGTVRQRFDTLSRSRECLM